jgi:dephospho-CoA kinase
VGTAAAHLGLTGGIGSGKSTVAAMLAARGAAVIDSDAISRATTAAGGAALPAIAKTFGPQLIGPDGALDRAAMRALVFADDAARHRLEAIVHPLVSAETERQAAQAAAEQRALVVFDVPLLAEAGPRWRRRLDQVLVIDCEPETQINRVAARNQHAREQVMAIMAAQASRAERLAVADVVIFNGAAVPLDALRTQVGQLAATFGL